MASTVSVSRAVADKALAEFMSGVRQVNAAESPFAFRVNTVVLFGSFLGPAEELGDVDLAIELKPRLQNQQQQDILERDAVRLAPADLTASSTSYAGLSSRFAGF